MEIREDDFFFGLELEEFEDEADEWGGFRVRVSAADVGEFDRAVEERGGVEGEALFFVVERVEDAVAGSGLSILPECA